MDVNHIIRTEEKGVPYLCGRHVYPVCEVEVVWLRIMGAATRSGQGMLRWRMARSSVLEGSV